MMSDVERVRHARRLVVSAVNLTEAGPLTVLRDCLASFSRVLPENWEIIALVNNRGLLTGCERVVTVEMPEAKKSWRRRLLLEWRGMRHWARRLRPDLWLSLHDITPDVGSVPQAVYCHNAMPFARLTLKDYFFEPLLVAFRNAYGFIYRRHIDRNFLVIVQQEWMRKEFRKWVKDPSAVLVAHPRCAEGSDVVVRREGISRFVYPSFPRPFKNLEVICRALELLEKSGKWRGSVLLTIDGNENRYARWIRKKFGHLRSLQLIGRQTSEEMQALYASVDCLLFPSRLESWGLPISEAIRWGLPVIVADLPYARESVGNCRCAQFVDVADHSRWADAMLRMQNGSEVNCPPPIPEPGEPFAADWDALAIKLIAHITES